MAVSKPGITDIKVLFARSGNQCAFPRCNAPMAMGQKLIGHVCHIKGAKLGSARFDASQSDAERHSYPNLILMCPTHHTVIDDDEAAYTVERLKLLKLTHENGSAPVSEADATVVAESFVNSVSTVGQRGGISAHTVSANTINILGGPPPGHIGQRQVEAVEELWNILQAFRHELSLAIFAHDILTPEELRAHFSGNRSHRPVIAVQGFAGPDAVMNKMTQAGMNSAPRLRPFISHSLWKTFFAVQGAYGRASYLITQSFERQSYQDWRDDGLCQQHFQSVLSATTIDEAKAQKVGGLQKLIDLMEEGFLTESWRSGAPP